MSGLDVTDIKFVLVQDCIHSREFYRDAHFVLLNYTCRCAGKPRVKLNHEARESKWVTPAVAAKMPLNAPTRILFEAVLKTWKRRARPPRAQRLTPRQPQMEPPTTGRRRQHAGARVLPKSKSAKRKS
jgi:hypothetical protein